MMKPVLFLSLSTAVVWSTTTMSLAFSPTPSTFSSTRAFGSISSFAKVPAHRDWRRSALRLSDDKGDADKDNEKATISRISPYSAIDWPFLVGLSLVGLPIVTGMLPSLYGYGVGALLLLMFLLGASNYVQSELKEANGRWRFFFIPGAILYSTYCFATGAVPTVFGLGQDLQTPTVAFLVLVEIFQIEFFPSLLLGFCIGAILADRDTIVSFLQAAQAAAGPILLSAGAFAIAAGIAEQTFVAERGSAIVPTSNAYSFVRHPIYAGILAAAWGWTIETGGGVRVVMSLLLWYLLNEQASKDEARLLSGESREEYERYKERVRSKLVPLFWPKSTSLWSPFDLDL